MDTYELIMNRRSERKFSDKEVSDDLIEKIIDAGLSAPSGMNSQPWHFTVIKDKATLQDLVDICRKEFLEKGSQWRKNWAKQETFNPFYAPNVIIVISNNKNIENSNEDCCFAIENMVLMAEGLGLSSCIIRDICWAINKSNQDRFNIDKEFDCFMCISIGYSLNNIKVKKKLDYSKVNYIK